MDIITELHDDDQLILLNNTISTSLATSFWWEQQDPVAKEVNPDMSMGEKEKEEDHREEEEEEEEELGAMKEMMYKMAAMQPVNIDPTTIHKPKRRNVRISDDPQSVAARRRRERISEKIRILQRLVPGGTKMDTASMLDEAVRYLKFLKRQIKFLQTPHAPTLADHHQLNIINLNTSTATTTTTWPALFFHEPPPSAADDQIIYPPPPHPHHHPN